MRKSKSQRANIAENNFSLFPEGLSAGLPDLGQTTQDKLRGGYYTDPSIAHWLCSWAIRDSSDHILEPSCGDGVFLEAAVARMQVLGVTPRAIQKQLRGIELFETEVRKSRRRLRTHVGSCAEAVVSRADFFDWLSDNLDIKFNCVIGNPPFIRYQNFPEPSRSKAMLLMKRMGLHPNRLTNTWVPFVVGSVSALAPGGRLALVLPAELLQVSYAAGLRSFLVDRFSRIDIVTCNELFFEKAEQEVVLLLADNCRTTSSPTAQCRIDLLETSSVKELLEKSVFPGTTKRELKVVEHDNEKWLKYLLASREIGLMRDLRKANSIGNLKLHGEVDVGVVTGKNDFFVLSQEDVRRFGLSPYTCSLIGRSSHLKGASLTLNEWSSLAKAGERVFLLNIPASINGSLSDFASRYIKLGEASKIHTGYKCSIRKPWYSVPTAWAPDCFLFRQIYDFPRVVLNKARATSTDTIHRFKCTHDPHRVLSNLYTYLTAASAEIEGRSYGGGVLELEPTEAERLLMPKELCKGLSVSEIDLLIRRGQLKEVLEINSNLVLIEGLGLAKRECQTLRNIWMKLRDRRLVRRKRTILP